MNFTNGDWVYYFHPRCYQGKQDKWIKKYLGPYLVVDSPSSANVTLQARPRAKKFTVHIDKVKPFAGETPKSRLKANPEGARQMTSIATGIRVLTTNTLIKSVEAQESASNSVTEEKDEVQLEYAVETSTLNPNAAPFTISEQTWLIPEKPKPEALKTQSINQSIKIWGLTCNQKLAETSLIYRTEPKQDRRCRKNGEQPESIMSVQERERGPMVGRICERGRF